MKIKESTSYPHPVLTPWSDDIGNAAFSAKINFKLDEAQNQVAIHCTATLDHPDIVALIENGDATFGCFIRGQETGLRRLQRLGFPNGSQQFASGALIGRVQLRPMIWSLKPIPAYHPAGAHAEFAGGTDLGTGQILALDDEHIIDVTRPPLPPLESIFEIQSSEDVEDGAFKLDTEADRITVRMPPATYQLVQELRNTDDAARTVLMNALYAPVIMEVLDHLQAGEEQFEEFRWLHPFRTRCEIAGVDLTEPDLLNDAQKILLQPFASLGQLVDYGDDE